VISIFGREPTAWLQAISAVLAVFVTFGLDGLSATQAALIVAAVSAGIGVVNALAVRPIAPAAFTAFVAAGAALLTGYGLGLSQELVGAVQVAVVAALALLVRPQVTPVADPVPREVAF
jgi:hypothetical protein